MTFPSDVTSGTGTAVTFPSDVTLGTGTAVSFPSDVTLGTGTAVSFPSDVTSGTGIAIILGLSSASVNPFPRGGDSQNVKNHGEPRRGKGSRAIPKSLRRAVFPRSKLSLLPTIGERFGEWFEVLLRTRRMRWL